MGTPLLIHQPSYSMLNRWVEDDHLLDTLEQEGVGCIVFSPLAQGLLSDKYLNGVPEDSRANKAGSFDKKVLSEDNLKRVRALNDVAQSRGQSLAQMALAWVLRDPRVTSALIGASSVAQIEENVAALDKLDFGEDEVGRHRALYSRWKSQGVSALEEKGYSQSVFLNCPFDEQYTPLFQATIFAIMDCKFSPRCALEVTGGRARSGFTRFTDLLRSVNWVSMTFHVHS